MCIRDRAQNLKKLRKMNNYSMSAVADKLELSSHGVYANWEYGRNEPNVATLVSIAKLYNVTIDELVGLSLIHIFINIICNFYHSNVWL